MKTSCIVYLTTIVALSSIAFAQDKKSEDKKGPPAVKLALPLGLSPGETRTITLRGARLDETSEVKTAAADVASSDVQVKLLGKGKANVPEKYDAKIVGDTQVEIELTLPAEHPTGEVLLTLVTPHGETTRTLLVTAQQSLIADHEPNGGFHNAQPIELGKTVDGTIEKPKDVDVFRVELAAGQRLIAELDAAKLGAPLDGLLTLYNSRWQTMADGDDQGQSRDARVEFTASTAGAYYLSLIDAHDQGSKLHVYRLRVATP